MGVRDVWIEKRLEETAAANGTRNVSQMHFARKGVITEEMAYVARRERLDRRSVRRRLPLGFLSPRVVEAIVEGRQPRDLSVMALIRRIDLPLLWSAQEQTLGLVYLDPCPRKSSTISD